MLHLLLRRLQALGAVQLETIPGRHQVEPIHRRTQQDQRVVVITGAQVANGWDLECAMNHCFLLQLASFRVVVSKWGLIQVIPEKIAATLARPVFSSICNTVASQVSLHMVRYALNLACLLRAE